MVRVLSRIKQFDLPPDGLLPIYKLQMLTGTYEKETVDVCKKIIRPGMTIFDIGAHVGYYTLLFSRLVEPKGRVLAFEPHPRNFDILRKNVERHSLQNVSLIQKAVSNADGNSLFYETAGSMGHSLHPVKSHVGQFPVELTSVETVLGRAGLGEVHFMKIDVEGGELEVLDGMRHVAKRCQELYLIVEFKRYILRKRNCDPFDLLERLFDMDFEVFIVGRRGKLRSLTRSNARQILSSIEKCNLLGRKVLQV